VIGYAELPGYLTPDGRIPTKTGPWRNGRSRFVSVGLRPNANLQTVWDAIQSFPVWPSGRRE
jgi:hypothetical protein